MNFSLRSLLVFTAGVAIVAASLIYPEPIVGDVYYTIGLLTIAIALLAAILVRGASRTFWIGFVVLFAIYFCHSVWPSGARNESSILWRMKIESYESHELITTRVLAYLFDFMHPSPASPEQMSGTTGWPGGRAMSTDQFVSFLAIGHTAIALLLGLCGGELARRFAAHGELAKRPADRQ